MSILSVRPGDVAEAIEVLARAMLDDGEATYLMPDPRRRLELNRILFACTVECALLEGDNVDVAQSPIAGVAVWRAKSAIGEAGGRPRRQSPHMERARELAGPDGLERARIFQAVLHRLRTTARPDRHLYLDALGVVPRKRRGGIATALLDAGHTRADELRLPCALETLSDENVRFYMRRGYRIVTQAALPESDLTITSMRRDPPPTHAGCGPALSASRAPD